MDGLVSSYAKLVARILVACHRDISTKFDNLVSRMALFDSSHGGDQWKVFDPGGIRGEMKKKKLYR
jgi:hypothetical protein